MNRELPWPKPSVAWWALLLFFVAAVLSYTDRQILSLLIDPVRGELAITDTQASLLLGPAFAFVYVLVGIPVSPLITNQARATPAWTPPRSRC